MAVSGSTTRLGLPFPLLADTPDAEAALKQLAEKLDEIVDAEGEDIYQEGVVIKNNSALTMTATINGGTGAISSAANISGTAYLKQATEGGGGPRIRTLTTAKNVGPLAPPSLPAAGKFMAMAVTAKANKFNQNPTFAIVCGEAKATQAEAEAAYPNKEVFWLCDMIVENAAGVYSIKKQRDRRQWAAGADGRHEQVGVGAVATGSETVIVEQFRLETNAGSLIIESFFGFQHSQTNENEETVVTIKVFKDATVIDEFLVKIKGSTKSSPFVASTRVNNRPGEATGLYKVTAQVTTAAAGVIVQSMGGVAGTPTGGGHLRIREVVGGAGAFNGTT